MKVIAIGLFALLIMSCGTKRKAENSTDRTEMKKENKNENQKMDVIQIVATIDKPNRAFASAPVEINSVEIEGNTMYVEITYTGGCETHEFQALGSPMVAKSMPPIRTMQIFHKSKGDTCEKLQKAKLEILLNELAYIKEVGNEIYLVVDGWEKRILYTYQEGK